MIRPIPRRLLPHTVTLYIKSGNEYDPVVLKNVYVELRKGSSLGKTGESANNNVLLIVDMTNSKAYGKSGGPLPYAPPKWYRPGHWTLKDRDLFVIGRTDPSKSINEVKEVYPAFTIRSVEVFYHPGSNKIRHFEVGGA